MELGRCGAAVREAPCGSADWLRIIHSIFIYSRSSRRKSRFWMLLLKVEALIFSTLNTQNSSFDHQNYSVDIRRTTIDYR